MRRTVVFLIFLNEKLHHKIHFDSHISIGALSVLSLHHIRRILHHVFFILCPFLILFIQRGENTFYKLSSTQFIIIIVSIFYIVPDPVIPCLIIIQFLCGFSLFCILYSVILNQAENKNFSLFSFCYSVLNIPSRF